MNSLRSLAAALSNHQNSGLLVCGSASFILYFFLSRQGATGDTESLKTTLHLFWAILAALFALLFVAVMIVRASGQQQNGIRLALIIIFAGALVFRLALVGQSPWLSNDIFRYLWDGRLVDHGINPYAFPPKADELAHLRDAAIHPNVDHKHVHSVYPPVLQILFWSGWKTSQFLGLPPVVALKLLFVVFDLGLVLALFGLLAQMQIDARWAVLYAWHPLPIIEIAGSGHTDGAGALTLILMLSFLLRKRFALSAAFLALGFLIKFITAFFLPFLFVDAWREAGLKKAVQVAALAALIILVCYAPFAAAGENLYSGLLVYSEKWRFNDGFFSLVYTPIHWLLPDWLVKLLMIPAHWEINPQVYVTRRIDLALIMAKLIVGVLFAFVYLRLLLRQLRGEMAPQVERLWVATLITILAAFFLLSPTFQPWYLLWMLPLLCLRDAIPAKELVSSTILPLWILSATVFLSYAVLANYLPEGIWQEPVWARWVEYGIPFGVWLWFMRKRGTWDGRVSRWRVR